MLPATVRPYALTFLVLACGVRGLCAAEVPALEPAEAAARVASGEAVLVDVREANEWAETGVVATAHTLALSDLRGPRSAWKAFLAEHKDKELILYCRSGNRSGQAARVLAGEGYRVANAGGLRDWVAAGQPTRTADQPRREAEKTGARHAVQP